MITTRREAREKRHFLSPIPLKMIGRSLRQRISGPHRTRPDHLRGLSKGNDMADSSILMPGASEAYRDARDRLRSAEIELRDRIEEVAAMRRSLPPGPVVPDYEFIEGGKRVRLSELFADGKPYLILYHLMYWADDHRFCPMCSLWIDGFNGIAPHVTQRANFVIASRAPIDRLQAWGAHREWHRLRLLSDDGPAFARAIDAEDARCRRQAGFDDRRLRKGRRRDSPRLHSPSDARGPRAWNRLALSRLASFRSHAMRPRRLVWFQ